MSQITKRALEQSLKKQMLSKPLTKVTINDITEDCGISRMTFYYHFKDIYDLVEWSCMEDAKRALENRKDSVSWQDGLLRIFEAAQDNKPFIMNVYRSLHQEQVEKYLRPQVDQLVLNIVNAEPGAGALNEGDKAFIARIYAYIFVGVMLDWIQADMSTQPGQIVERLTILLKGTITEAVARFQNTSFPAK